MNKQLFEEEIGCFLSWQFQDEHGFTSKSVLCMPIHNSDRTIIGVTQLINKVNGQPFDDNDEHLLEVTGNISYCLWNFSLW